MLFRTWPCLLVAALLSTTHVAAAAVPFADAEAGAKQVTDRKVAAYREVLAGFDEAMRQAPDDPAIAVERCRFIGQYIDDEYGDWVEPAPVEFQACRAALAERWPKAPVAQLFALQQLWGAEAVEMGERLLEQADAWPRPLRQALVAKVSEAQEANDNDDRAGELAVQAVRLGDAGRAARAVRYLVSRREFAEAAKLLADAAPATQAWVARERVEVAMDLPDRRAALAELERYADAGWSIGAAVAAQAQLRAGNVAAARALVEGEEDDSETLRQVRFEVAMAAGDAAMAATTLDFADTDNFEPNMQRFMVLATQAPATLLQGPMMVGILVFLMLGLMLALLPGVLLVPVHYRGLVRRMRGRPAVPLFEAIGMRGAWWAGAVFLAVPSLVAMVAEPTLVSRLLGGELPDGKGAFRAMALGALAGLLCVLPATRATGIRRLAGDLSSLRAASWRVPVAWACLICIGMAIAAWHNHFGGGGETLQTRTVDALTAGGAQTYGPVATLLMIAVLVPVFEELVFRGLLLGGLSRYISFGWANLLQATAFAVIHDDPPRFVFYLALGLLGGWLVRRTNALGPAIALHALNNALAFALKTGGG